MFLDRMRYELKLVGIWIIIIPLILVAGFALLIIPLQFFGMNIPRLLSAGLEMLLPVAIGLLVATTSTHDPALELQLTMPQPYAGTTLRRLILALVWTACIALLASILIGVCKQSYLPAQMRLWPVALQALASMLIWLAPLLWFVGLGLCAALLLRSRSSSGSLLGALWIIETLFLKNLLDGNDWLRPFFLFPTTLLPQDSFWLVNRLEVSIMGAGFIVLSWLLLHDKEALLKGASEE